MSARRPASRSGVAAVLMVLALSSGCEESTSGADRVATIEPEGVAPAESACSACARDQCGDVLAECGEACAPALECLEACSDTACEAECLDATSASGSEAAAVDACLRSRCLEGCASICEAAPSLEGCP